MHILKLLTFAFIGSFLISPSVSAQTSQGDAKALAGISATAQKFSAAYMRGDVDAMMDCYTNDAVIFPGGMDIVSDRDDVRRYWTLPKGVTITHHATMSEHVTVVGETAYDYGYYEGARSKDGADPVPFRGKYLVVWERGKDGVWRMKADMWNGRKKTE